MYDMPRLSIFKPEKGNDYKFFDRNIKEMFTVGGTDLHFHKYIGPYDQGSSQKDGDASPSNRNIRVTVSTKEPYRIYYSLRTGIENMLMTFI